MGKGTKLLPGIEKRTEDNVLNPGSPVHVPERAPT